MTERVPIELPAATEEVTRYVSADAAGTLAVMDVRNDVGALTGVTYTMLGADGSRREVQYDVGPLTEDGYTISSTDSAGPSQTFTMAAGVCSSNGNLLSGIAGAIVSIGCGAAAIITSLPTAGVGGYAVIVGCTAGSGVTSYVVADNCSQATLCVPRVALTDFFCNPRVANGCHATGNVTANPPLGAGPSGYYTNNADYEYYYSPSLYFRKGTNTTAGNATLTQQLSSSNGVAFYAVVHDIITHTFACPQNSSTTMQLTIEGGRSGRMTTHLPNGCK